MDVWMPEWPTTVHDRGQVLFGIWIFVVGAYPSVHEARYI